MITNKIESGYCPELTVNVDEDGEFNYCHKQLMKALGV